MDHEEFSRLYRLGFGDEPTTSVLWRIDADPAYLDELVAAVAVNVESRKKIQENLEKAKQLQAERAEKEKARVPAAVGDIRKLAETLKSQCDCDRKDRSRYVSKVMALWPKPEVLNNGVWAVGVTTAPRSFGSAKTCLDSLRINGWKPHVFAEPGSELPEELGDCEYTLNPERLGVWRNFVNMGKSLLKEYPKAKLFLLVQDDTVVVPGVRAFVEPRLLKGWPGGKSACFVSLYTPEQYAKGKKVGCHRIHTKSLWGACALVFTRETLSSLLGHSIAKSWNGVRFKTRTRPRESWEVANSDTAVGKIANAQKRGMFFYVPSLAQHVAPVSSISHGGDIGLRAASEVVSDWRIFRPRKVECPPRPGIIRVGVCYASIVLGGAELWLATLLKNLDRTRFDVSGVAVVRDPPDLPKVQLGDTLITHDMEDVAKNSDVLIVWNIPNAHQLKKFGVPMVYVSHSQPDQVSVKNRLLAASADHIVAVSQSALMGVPEARRADAIVIPNGIERMALPPREQARSKLAIGDRLAVSYVGRWTDEKGAFAAANAVSAIPNAVAIYHGYRKVDEQTFKKKIASMVGIKRVVFRSPADPVAETYAASDVFVHVPPSEAFGLTYLEAMQAGVPIVSSGKGVISECGEDVSEIVPSTAGADELAQAVLRAVSRADRIELGKIISERYSVASMVAKWEDAFSEIVTWG